jgi:hypothetical protein
LITVSPSALIILGVGLVTVTEAQMASVRLERHRFHGDWNYAIHPAPSTRSKSVIS